jgi:Spy/CpxP family protein refolding chaperone
MMSIRFVRQAVVVCLATVLVSAFVQAQPPGGGRGGPGGFGGGRGGFTVDRAMLLGAEKVRTELKIEEAQAATIDAALAAYREERSSAPRPDRDAIQAMTEEERTAYFEKSQKEREELSKKTDEVLNALLEPEQAKRLDQIALQLKLSSATVATLKSDDMKSKLSLTAEQLAKLDEAEKAAAADMTKMFEEMRAAGGGQPGGRQPGGGAGAGFAAMQEKMAAARAKSTEAMMAVLTEEQKKTIEELKGPKFELDMRSLFGGGRGGPPGGGRQRGAGGGRGTRPPAE